MCIMRSIVIFSILLCCVTPAFTLDNGLVRTPPMGWLDWERYRCNIREELFMGIADRLVADGWREAGYVFVNIDNCWSKSQRDETGRLVADPVRFPSGIKKLADYMHERGLKLGIYGDCGTRTCGGGYPGSLGYEKIDAETFAEWGVDMLKYDGCNSNETMKAIGYPAMSKALNETGRPIVYSCSWPAYNRFTPSKVNYTLMGEICNLWRNYNDIDDHFLSVYDIINWFGDHQDFLIPAAGPGRWNDPDMLIVGDFSLSQDESQMQFGMWAILAAPLFMSNDLNAISKNATDLLQNREIIDINQDPLGIPGRRITSGETQLWVRPLLDDQLAIAVISFRNGGSSYDYTFQMSSLEIKGLANEYMVKGILNDKRDTIVWSDTKITVKVNPNGIVMLKATPVRVHEKITVEEYLEFDLL